MRPTLCSRILLLGGLAATLLAGDVASAEGVTYVIPIKDVIERGLVYVVRRGVAQAIREGADAIVFDMDTPGGRLDAAEEIIKLIGNIDVPTCTYVNPNAISAGAIISMATDHIYMAPRSRIGDAMPIMMSPLGGVQEMSEGLQEKSVSFVAGLIRSTAQSKGHDPQLAEAMVRREMEYKIGDDLICAEGQLLTLTNVEAERMVGPEGEQRHLLSSGTVDGIDALLEALGKKGSRIVEMTISPAERVARYIEMLSVLFLAGGLLGIYTEIKTPGFGLPGILGILLLAVWFWGHHIAGLAGMGEVLLFIVGLILIGVEIFVVPGFGFTGIAGIVLMLTALMMAMVQHYPGGPITPPVTHLEGAVKVLGLTLVVTAAFVAVLARLLPETPLFQRIMLTSSLGSDRGYTAAAKTHDLVGLRGAATTALHPAGIGTFGDKRLNVVAQGTFIDQGTPIVVAEAHGSRIVVQVSKPELPGDHQTTTS